MIEVFCWFKCCFRVDKQFFEFDDIVSWFQNRVVNIWNRKNCWNGLVAFVDSMQQWIIDESFDDDQWFEIFECFIKNEKLMRIQFSFFESIKFDVICFKINNQLIEKMNCFVNVFVFVEWPQGRVSNKCSTLGLS